MLEHAFIGDQAAAGLFRTGRYADRLSVQEGAARVPGRLVTGRQIPDPQAQAPPQPSGEVVWSEGGSVHVQVPVHEVYLSNDYYSDQLYYNPGTFSTPDPEADLPHGCLFS